MREACSLIWTALVGLFRSRASLAAEILVLRHQINVLRRSSPKRQIFSAIPRPRRDNPDGDTGARPISEVRLSVPVGNLIRLASEAESRNVSIL
jgi:hypothetical protein